MSLNAYTVADTVELLVSSTGTRKFGATGQEKIRMIRPSEGQTQTGISREELVDDTRGQSSRSIDRPVRLSCCLVSNNKSCHVSTREKDQWNNCTCWHITVIAVRF